MAAAGAEDLDSGRRLEAGRIGVLAADREDRLRDVAPICGQPWDGLGSAHSLGCGDGVLDFVSSSPDGIGLPGVVRVFSGATGEQLFGRITPIGSADGKVSLPNTSGGAFEAASECESEPQSGPVAPAIQDVAMGSFAFYFS